ncbi:PRC-barrel domain-containing protein [Maricaulis sp. CAU 1757]
MASYLLSAGSLTGDKVVSTDGDDLGHIEELMIDPNSARVEYAVLSFGGFLGLGDKLFAIPLTEMTVDRKNERIVLNVEKERLKEAPGFDKDNWPDFADTTFRSTIDQYYTTTRTIA